MSDADIKEHKMTKMMLEELKKTDSLIIEKEEELQKIKIYRENLNTLLNCEPYKSLIGKELYTGIEAEPIDFKTLPTKLRIAFSRLGFSAWGDVIHCQDLILKMTSLRGIGTRTVVLLNIELAFKGLKLKVK